MRDPYLQLAGRQQKTNKAGLAWLGVLAEYRTAVLGKIIRPIDV
jgi:hypothetical protein